jgi:hypothetical protein
LLNSFAGPAQMHHVAGEGPEHERAALGRRQRTADHGGQPVLLGGWTAAADRCVQHLDIALRAQLGQSDSVAGQPRAVVDDDCAGTQILKDLVDQLQDVGVGAHAQADDVAGGSQLPGRVVPLVGDLAQAVQGCGAPGPGVQGDSCFGDRRGHGQALVTQSDEPHDGSCRSSRWCHASTVSGKCLVR